MLNALTKKVAVCAVWAVLLTGIALPAAQAGVAEDVLRIRTQWEQIKYASPEKDQEEALEKLARESAKIKAANASDASAAIWHGIIEASHAGAKGGMGALGLVKSAKQSFEDALVINPTALDGSAYTSLGSLYYQVPGWPIGFGDDKKAAELLKKGLALNPNGIDSNFFYGDFLFRSGDYEAAQRVLKKALQAPAREGRALADEGRKREINELLAKLEKKMAR